MSRQKRFEMYELLDPNHQFQKIGYDYLISEKDINIKSIEGHSYNLLSVPDWVIGSWNHFLFFVFI